MLTRRLFARCPLLAYLLMFAILLTVPTSAAAKVYMVNGRDGAEGDPTDGNDFIGGGSSGLVEGDFVANQQREVKPVLIPTMTIFLVGPTSEFLFVGNPSLRDMGWTLHYDFYYKSEGSR